jgi:lipopolysaccharide export system permease protein
MAILSRYVLREHFLPFVLGFALIVFVLLLDVVLQMMDQVLSKGLSLWLGLQLLLYNMAWIVALAAPMAVLMAVLMVFARLAADGELLAAKACGVGFGHLLRPALLASAALALLMILFNDRVLPDWNHRARNLSASLARRKAALVFKEKEGLFIHDLGDYSLLVRRVDPASNQLFGISLYDASRPGPPSTLHARRGQLQIFGDGSYARLSLEEGEFHRFAADDPERFLRGTFRRQVIHVVDSERAFEARRSAYRSDREMDIAAMYRAVEERRAEQQRDLAGLDSSVAAFIDRLAQEQPAGGLADSRAAPPDLAQEALSLSDQLRRQQRLLESRQARINEFLVEIHKKFSIPLACPVFVLVGAPLGTLVRRRGAAVSVGISLICFWIYWMFLIGGEELADRGYLAPALAMWAPNLFFGLLGLVLLRRTALDRPWWPGRPAK